MTKNEIIAIIAERTGASRAEVRLFLDKMNETLFQGLNDDKLVKIKGLGTFKMVSVKARKSVSVNGGETIEIPAHNKVTFTADKLFADMVNEPLAHLEVVELTDTPDEEEDPAEEGADDYVASSRMKKLSDDAEELKGLLADINGLSTGDSAAGESREVEEPIEEEQQVEEQQEEEPIEEEQVEEVQVPVTEEPAETEEPKPGIQQENPYRPVAENNQNTIVSDDEDEEKRTGMTHGGKLGRIFLWSMVFLLIIVGSIYWVNFGKDSGDVPVVKEKPVVVRHDETAVREDTVSEENRDTLPESREAVTEPQVAEQGNGRLTIGQMRTMKIDFNAIQGTETVRDGSRLTMIAMRAYGSKDFWIYVFLANRDQLSNPGQISTGMVIKIPKIDSRLVDASNPDCLQYAKELQAKYVK